MEFVHKLRSCKGPNKPEQYCGGNGNFSRDCRKQVSCFFIHIRSQSVANGCRFHLWVCLSASIATSNERLEGNLGNYWFVLMLVLIRIAIDRPVYRDSWVIRVILCITICSCFRKIFILGIQSFQQQHTKSFHSMTNALEHDVRWSTNAVAAQWRGILWIPWRWHVNWRDARGGWDVDSGDAGYHWPIIRRR